MSEEIKYKTEYIPNHSDLMMKGYELYCYSLRIGILSRRLTYFTHHLGRCKRTKDIVRLTVLSVKTSVELGLQMEELKMVLILMKNDFAPGGTIVKKK